MKLLTPNDGPVLAAPTIAHNGGCPCCDCAAHDGKKAPADNDGGSSIGLVSDLGLRASVDFQGALVAATGDTESRSTVAAQALEIIDRAAPANVGMADAVPSDISTAFTLANGSSVTVVVDTLGDHDWYRVDLVAGTTYVFSTWAIPGQGPDTFLTLRDGTGSEIVSNDDGGPNTYSVISYTATATGAFYIDASAFEDESIGSYRLTAVTAPSAGADTAGASTSTTAALSVGNVVAGRIDTSGDRDWYAITLTEGESYVFRTGPATADANIDTRLTVRDAAGDVLAENDDTGDVLFSGLRFIAPTSGTYYLEVRGFSGVTGDFLLTAYTAPPLELFTNDQIANQLTDGYWGGASRHFDVAPGGTITYNVTGLTAAGVTLATEAFALWSDVTGITFTAVTTGGQIILDDEETGAFARSTVSGGVISVANVNVGTAWLTTNGTGLNSYSFQTYLHEIGHALGLGHSGNYNTSANYSLDANYLNDSWGPSVMSYFDQIDNEYFSGQGFTRQFTVTPMVADAIATTALYGMASTTRTGDTVYGFNNSSGRAVYDAVANPAVGYTVHDHGGTDTLDYSGFSQNQRINLNEETFSNVGGAVGNVSIARGTVIENAIGGNGTDLIIGNAGNNILDGRTGADRMFGGNGDDSYLVDDAGDIVFENAGEGTDHVSSSVSHYLYANVENLTLTGSAAIFGVGNELANVLTGNAGENLLIAGAGADTVRGGDARDAIFGEGGDDQLFGDAGVDYIVAGIGNDSVDGGVDADEIYGQDGDDVLNGGTSFHTDILVGGAGNDTIRGDGGQGDFDFLYGDLGNDIFYVDTPADLVFEQAGEGSDTVFANINGAGFYLYDNIENLTLLGNTPFGVGNGLANTITGNAQGNFLLGGAGDDVLNGLGGGDVLFGEAGADTFVFGRGTGGDVIGDFARGVDRIDLRAFGFTSFAQLQAAFIQNGDVGAINLGNGDLVVLHNVTMNQLVAADFMI